MGVGGQVEFTAARFRRLEYTENVCGCKFYLASDAHTPEQLNVATERFQRAIDLLDLTEDDKFKI